MVYTVFTMGLLLKGVRALFALCGFAMFSVACGGGTRYQGSWFEKPDAHPSGGTLRYRLIAPPSLRWQRLANSDVSADLAWRNRASRAVIQVHASCEKDLDVPLQTLTRHLTIGFTETQTLAQDVVQMDGRESLRTHILSKLDGVPLEFMMQVLKKDSCVYDFVLAASPSAQDNSFRDALPDFDALIRGFHAP